jgi:hypothetical protein
MGTDPIFRETRKMGTDPVLETLPQNRDEPCFQGLSAGTRDAAEVSLNGPRLRGGMACMPLLLSVTQSRDVLEKSVPVTGLGEMFQENRCLSPVLKKCCRKIGACHRFCIAAVSGMDCASRVGQWPASEGARHPCTACTSLLRQRFSRITVVRQCPVFVH